MAESQKNAKKTSEKTNSTKKKNDVKKKTTQNANKNAKQNNKSKTTSTKTKKNTAVKNNSVKKEATKPKEEVKVTKEEIKTEKKHNHVIKYILYVVILVLVVIFGISGYKIISWKIDNNKTQELIDDLEKSVKVKNTTGENVIPTVDISDETFPYLMMDFIDVDIDKLKKDNKETVGWIQVAGTKVNYPFVQTKDNDYYLNHSIDGTVNEAGWIFLDTRNKLWNQKNTIIYGHGRLNKTMFGSLNDILDNGWTKNKDNFVIKISTENENTLWQIFSVYHMANQKNPDYSQIYFKDNNEYKNFINKLKNRSMYDFKTSVSENDTIITLSTCYSNDEKMVVHARLIKFEDKTISTDAE